MTEAGAPGGGRACGVSPVGAQQGEAWPEPAGGHQPPQLQPLQTTEGPLDETLSCRPPDGAESAQVSAERGHQLPSRVHLNSHFSGFTSLDTGMLPSLFPSQHDLVVFIHIKNSEYIFFFKDFIVK